HFTTQRETSRTFIVVAMLFATAMQNQVVGQRGFCPKTETVHRIKRRMLAMEKDLKEGLVRKVEMAVHLALKEQAK
ncbi:MAG: hypothetical protein M1823_003942, partial [Watsoniomyces obsoletus]